MTKKEMMNLLKTIERFASVQEWDDNEIVVRILDEYKIPQKYLDKIDEVEDIISENCSHLEGDLYMYYDFEDFYVVWGYTSFDE